jgi:hypothetical protein
MTEKILTYTIHSEYQAGPTTLRILLPEKPASSSPLTHLYILPVNPGLDTPWGDGLETLRDLGLHETYHLLAVAPSFSDWPWYADHPSDPHLQQESYLLRQVIPRVDALYPDSQKTRWLVGFSKSGFGAFSLILRNPGLFHAAAAWDAPLMMTCQDEFVMPETFGTSENFNHYSIPLLLNQQSEIFRRRKPRLGLFGYSNFRKHLQSAHELLNQLHIPHAFTDGPYRPHRWDSGWLEEAVAFLVNGQRRKQCQ